MRVEGLDYTQTQPYSKLQEFVSDGISFIARYYCTGACKNKKVLTKEEAKDITRAGIQVVAVYQKSADKVDYFTYEQGSSDCQNAANAAEEVGQPHDTTIYFAVDTVIKEEEFYRLTNYFKGIVDKMAELQYKWNVGVYGNYSVIKHVHENCGIPFIWQTAISNKEYPHNGIFQYKLDTNFHGVEVDRNYATGNIGGFMVH